MCIDSVKWAREFFIKNGCNVVVNCGDTMDNHISRSIEITALSEAYKEDKLPDNYKEYIILGNHEILAEEDKFSSVSPVFLNDYCKLITKPEVLEVDGIKLSMLPYRRPDKVTHDLLKSIQGDILFSHIDIKGSKLRQDYTADFGVDPEMISMYFKGCMNGHIHTQEHLHCDKSYAIWNVGSLTSYSFSDSNSYLPSCHILDTDTMKLVSYNNPYAILFRKISAKSLSELNTKLKDVCDTRYKYCVRATVPYNIRNDAQIIIEKHKNIITSRVITDLSKDNKTFDKDEIDEISLNITNDDNIKLEFLNYIKNFETIENTQLKYPYQKYIDVVNKVIEQDKESDN